MSKSLVDSRFLSLQCEDTNTEVLVAILGPVPSLVVPVPLIFQPGEGDLFLAWMDEHVARDVLQVSHETLLECHAAWKRELDGSRSAEEAFEELVAAAAMEDDGA